MLKKRDTLTLRKEQQFFNSASRIHHKHFSLFWLSNKSRLLLQVIISKKATQKAVERNASKRVVKKLLSEIMMAHKDSKKSIVVVIKNKVALNELTNIKTELEFVITQR